MLQYKLNYCLVFSNICNTPAGLTDSRHNDNHRLVPISIQNRAINRISYRRNAAVDVIVSLVFVSIVSPVRALIFKENDFFYTFRKGQDD